MLNNNEMARELLPTFLQSLEHSYRDKFGGVPPWLLEINSIDTIAMEQALKETIEKHQADLYTHLREIISFSEQEIENHK